MSVVPTPFFVVSGLSIAAILLLFYGPWQTLVIAWARQGMFELRDSWFDATAFSEETRDLPAARAIRDYCNRLIHGVELLSWPGLLTIDLYSRLGDAHVPQGTLSKNIHALPNEELRKMARHVVTCTGFYVGAQMVARSFVGFPIGLWMMFKVGRHSAAGYRLVQGLKKTEAAKLAHRELELAAFFSCDPQVWALTRRLRRATA